MHELLEMFANSGKKLEEFVENLWKKIADWFLKNRKTANAVDWMSSKLFKFGDDDRTFRNFLKLRQRATDEFYNVLCHGEADRVIINGRKYFPDTIKIRLPKELKEWYGADYPFDFDVSRILIVVPDEQFGSTGVFSIYFKDETMEPFMFHDGGAEGRVPDLEILKKNGKYVIGDEWKNE